MERELEESAEGADDLGEQITDSGANAEKAGGKFEKLGSILSGIGKAMGTVAAAAGGYLTVPLLALALLRLALVALEPAPRPGIDPLAVLLLGAWALAALGLLARG